MVKSYRIWILILLTVLTACSTSDDGEGQQPLRTVTAQLNMSLPPRIAHKHRTRMTSDVVQANSDENDFRGLTDVHMLCFNQYPTQTTNNLGSVIDMKTSGDEINDSITEEDYALSQAISIPVGTSHFSFYARADDAPRTHEDRMKYGIIETVGLSRDSYQGNSGIRFRPVQICTSDDQLGGSEAGKALLNLMNRLMNISSDDDAPNDRWATANNLYLNEAWKQMTQLSTLSSFHTEVMLGHILKLVNQEAPDEQGSKLVAAITNMIVDSCDPETTPDIENGVIKLKDSCQGFPADIHLPEGAARIVWDSDKKQFVVPDVQTYGNGLNVTSVNDYVYPMNLQYQVFSDILASDKLVMFKEEMATDPESQAERTDSTQFKNWQELIENGYADADKTVKVNTQSVAMVQQVQYAVGRLALRTRIGTDQTVRDANGHVVPMYNGVFTLKGYVVGGQREVDYDFQPLMSSRTYAIYDTDINDGPQSLYRHYFTRPDYILGLGTAANKSILVALELVNNGPAFQGADGLIVTGATFYLVANMNPLEGTNYSEDLNQIISKDRYTTVNITINSLSEATYGLPNLDIPRPTVGLTVDLKWEEGLWFDDIEL